MNLLQRIQRWWYFLDLPMFLLEALLIGLLLVLGIGGFVACDNILGKDIDRYGTVTSSYRVPEYTTMQMSGKVMIPVHHPETYYLNLNTQEGKAQIGVGYFTYSQAHEGDTINFTDKLGYFTNHWYKN